MKSPPVATSRRDCLTTLATAMLFGSAWAQQAWPTRVITLIVPWPSGNPTDALSRRLAPLLSKALGQPVIVENIAGAAGTLGVGRVATQPADGHTILMSTPSELIMSPSQVPAARYVPGDFRMVGLFGRVPYVLVSRPNLPQTSLAEVMALRTKTGLAPLSIGNIGPGSLIHLIAKQFEKVSGLSVNHIAYRGVPPMMQDLYGSQIDLAFVPLSGATMDGIAQGRLRSLGITASVPYALYPSLQPMASGHAAFAGFDFDVWAGMHLPKSVPAEVLRRLNQVFYEATQDTEFREWARLNGTSFEPPMGLAELERLYSRDINRYQEMAKAVPLTN